MWFALAAGSQVLGALGGYSAASAQAKAQKKLQRYKNKMTYIANAINQNAITTNTSLAIKQSARQAVHMRSDELSTLGSTAAAAAAAGVRGNSVNATLLNVQRRAGVLEKQRSQDLQDYFLQASQQRLSSAMSAAQNQDISHIPKPSLSSYLLGAAGNIFSMKAGM